MPLPAVVPAPAVLEAVSAAPFRLRGTTRVTGETDAADALARLLTARTGLTLSADSPGPAIHLRVEHGGPAESYALTADAESVVVTGADAAGLFYGVQTLGQLIAREQESEPGSARDGDGDGDGDGWIVPAVRIEDAPRFGYRGVMLDVARHFHPVETVEAYIDRAAGLKLNILHLHLTDDQGWRLALDSRPLLTERASATSACGDPGGFYSKDDYRRIVAHAASRHMTVVPEIDMPGHTHAVGLAHPELAEDPVITPLVRDTVREFGGGMPVPGRPYEGFAVGFSSLRIHDEASYDFVADVFGELAALTPGPYLHFGGDEAHGTPAEDFALFVGRVSRIIADLGKTPVAWHEAGVADDLDPSTVGQYWGFVEPTDGADDAARRFRGAGLVVSPADAAYLDMKPTADADLGLTWANGPTSVERSYAWDPAAIVEGISETDILGVEAPLWTETIRDLDGIDRMAFPRIASAAEIAWSPRTGPTRTWESFRTRVGGLGALWSALGIGFDRSAEIPWDADGRTATESAG